MSHNPAPGWIDRRVRTAMQGEMDALREAVEALAAQMAASRSEDRSEVAEAHAEIGRLRASIDKDRSEVAEAHAEIGQLRASIDELRGMFTGMLEDMKGRAERADAELQALRDAVAEREAIAERNMLAQQEVIAERAVVAEREAMALREGLAERDVRIEAVRVRLEGLMTQHRWDVEQLRESLAIVAERLPFTS